MRTQHRKLTAPRSQALPHCFAGMSPDPDPDTFVEAPSPGLRSPNVQSSPNLTPLSSESGSPLDDDLIHPDKSSEERTGSANDKRMVTRT
jgi:hypothetical protein